MAATYLDAILAHHRRRAAADERVWSDRVAHVRYAGPSFANALADRSNPNVKVIAEVKRRSPSKGWIDERLDVGTLSSAYQYGGATAISVLTDVEYFAGSTDDVGTVARHVDVPLLRKDFTVSANDVIDTAAMGAGAVLLIVAALSTEELELLLDVSRHVGLDALVEVHDVDQLDRALDCGATIVGVNQRDLHSFEVDTNRAATLMSRVPRGIVAVAESGIEDTRDVERLARCGFDAVLVGEAFVRAAEPGSLVRAFASIQRSERV